jgi:NAD(P) transhydrogenase subunit alpha
VAQFVNGERTAVIPTLAKAGLEVVVESGAGEGAGYSDSVYVEKGGKILPDRAAVFGTADIIVQVLCYGSNDVTGKADLPLLRRDQLLIGFLRPFGSAEVVQQIAAAGVTAFSVELVPRSPPWGRSAATKRCCWRRKHLSEFFP